MSDNKRLAEALKDILRRVSMDHHDTPSFKESVTEAFWEFKDRNVDLDCEYVEKWLIDAGCPEAHLKRILSWCRSIRRGGPRYRGPMAQAGMRVWVEDIWEKWGERALAG